MVSGPLSIVLKVGWLARPGFTKLGAKRVEVTEGRECDDAKRRTV